MATEAGPFQKSAAPSSAVARDIAISELSQADRDALDRRAWLYSMAYSTMYDHPPADRVVMQCDEGGKIVRAMFYRERRLAAILKIIQCAGFSDCSDAEIIELLRLRNAHVAIVNRLETPDSQLRQRPGRMLLTHDVIAELPKSKDAYFQSLGKQKRQQLPRYWRKLQREFGGHVQFRIQRAPDVELERIVQLIRFNQSRMERQGKSNTTIAETKKHERRRPLTIRQGLLCTIESQGRLLGGTFNYVHGGESVLIVIAHDPELERLNIGNLAVWKTIEHLIEHGINRYHLYWGTKQYKTQFGGRDFPVVLQVLSPHGWLALLWVWHMRFWRQVPRGFRFVHAGFRKLVSRAPQESSADHSADESEDSTAATDPR